MATENWMKNQTSWKMYDTILSVQNLEISNKRKEKVHSNLNLRAIISKMDLEPKELIYVLSLFSKNSVRKHRSTLT